MKPLAGARRVARAFAPYKLPLALTAAAVLASATLGLLPPFYLRALINRGLLRHDMAVVTRYTLLIMAATVGASLFGLAFGYLSASIGQRVMRDLRNQLYDHLQGMSLRFFTQTRAGEIQSRLVNDIGGVQSAVSDTAATVLNTVVIMVSTLIAMAWMDWRLTLLTLCLLPLFAVLAAQFGGLLRRIRRQVQEQLAVLNSTTQETLSVSGLLLIKTSGRMALARRQFEQENAALIRLQVRQAVTQRVFNSLMALTFALTPLLVYWQAEYLIAAHTARNLSLGTIFAFTAFQTRLFFPVGNLLNAQVEALSALALFDRIFEYLDLPLEITDAPTAVALDPKTVQGAVRFDHVSFRYDAGQERPTLDDLTFEAKPGDLVALVGPSGAGKTSLTYLIARLYDAESGQVSIDGRDVRDLQTDSLATVIGMVTQETYLVHDTIRENLRYGRPDASDEDLREAAKAAAIHAQILAMPQGYETVVGQRGYKLSGGEKQRIAIARALLKDPRILILDEATSSLDTQSERLIQQALTALQAGRTTFAVAHRLSTVLAADLILVLEGGRIVERGAHASLLAAGGVYARLYAAQFEDAG